MSLYNSPRLLQDLHRRGVDRVRALARAWASAEREAREAARARRQAEAADPVRESAVESARRAWEAARLPKPRNTKPARTPPTPQLGWLNWKARCVTRPPSTLGRPTHCAQVTEVREGESSRPGIFGKLRRVA